MRRLRWLAFLLVVIAVACASQGQAVVRPTPLPERAFPVTVRGEYQAWWAEVEECSGKKGDFQRVKWYAVLSNGRGFEYRGDWVAGLAYNDRYAIVMGMPWITSKGHVTHEMGHLIASPNGHDPEIYQRRCAHIVACFGRCLTDTLMVQRGVVSRNPE